MDEDSILGAELVWGNLLSLVQLSVSSLTES